MQIFKKIAVVAAIGLAFPMAAMAQSTKDLKTELDALKAQVKQLEAQVAKAAGQEAASDNVVDVAEFNRMRIKLEAMEDSHEASGFKSLKFSGYVDPTYMINRNAKTSSFVFLNNNSPVNGSDESFGYDNTYFGSGMLNLEKELEGGTKFKMTLMPSKSTAAGYNFGNLVHEATISVPLTDLSTRLIAGQMADWAGYEYIPSTQNKLITHNLLFDFSAANFYTGAGMEIADGKWITKFMVGNLNKARIDDAGNKTPGLFYRADYAKGEYSGFGFAGVHAGFDDKLQFGRTDLVEVDGYFTRGDFNMQGQLSYGRQAANDYNGYSSDKSTWYGFSALASYKITPRLEAIARLDYISNSKNGGGVFGSTFGGVCADTTGADANCPDGRNGFGSGMVFDGTDWVVADPSKGTNRSALSLGLSYPLMPNVTLKGEYRYDRSSGNVFKTSDDQYRRDNHVIGVSTVVSF